MTRSTAKRYLQANNENCEQQTKKRSRWQTGSSGSSTYTSCSRTNRNISRSSYGSTRTSSSDKSNSSTSCSGGVAGLSALPKDLIGMLCQTWLDIRDIVRLSTSSTSLRLTLKHTFLNLQQSDSKWTLAKIRRYFPKANRYWNILGIRISQPNIKSVNSVLTCIGVDIKYLDLSESECLVNVAMLRTTSLHTLNLSDCDNLIDISPLSNITQLQNLNLCDCYSLVNISPLSNITELHTLNLCGCFLLQDISPLSSLTHLCTLDLSWCKSLKDISPLSNIPKLHTLNLCRCSGLTDLSLLSSIYTLHTLELDEDQLQNVPPLSMYAHHYLGEQNEFKNEELAMKFFRLAAQQGHPNSQYRVGLFFHDAERSGSSSSCSISSSISSGSTSSSSSSSSSSNYETAFRFLRLAADQGEPNAQYWLGRCYATSGYGVEIDFNESFKFCKLAADQHHELAQLHVARLYSSGEGLARSDMLASKYFRLAAEHHGVSQFFCGEYFFQKGQYEEAIKYLKLAAVQGHHTAYTARAQFYLGGCFEEGKGIP